MLCEDKPEEKAKRAAQNSPFNPAKLAVLLAASRGADGGANGRASGSLSERGTAASGGGQPRWGAALASRAAEAARPLPPSGFILQLSVYHVKFDAVAVTFEEGYAPFKLAARAEAVERAAVLRGLRPHWHYRLRLSSRNGVGDSS